MKLNADQGRRRDDQREPAPRACWAAGQPLPRRRSNWTMSSSHPTTIDWVGPLKRSVVDRSIPASGGARVELPDQLGREAFQSDRSTGSRDTSRGRHPEPMTDNGWIGSLSEGAIDPAPAEHPVPHALSPPRPWKGVPISMNRLNDEAGGVQGRGEARRRNISLSRLLRVGQLSPVHQAPDPRASRTSRAETGRRAHHRALDRGRWGCHARDLGPDEMYGQIQTGVSERHH